MGYQRKKRQPITEGQTVPVKIEQCQYQNNKNLEFWVFHLTRLDLKDCETFNATLFLGQGAKAEDEIFDALGLLNDEGEVVCDNVEERFKGCELAFTFSVTEKNGLKYHNVRNVSRIKKQKEGNVHAPEDSVLVQERIEKIKKPSNNSNNIEGTDKELDLDDDDEFNEIIEDIEDIEDIAQHSKPTKSGLLEGGSKKMPNKRPIKRRRNLQNKKNTMSEVSN